MNLFTAMAVQRVSFFRRIVNEGFEKEFEDIPSEKEAS